MSNALNWFEIPVAQVQRAQDFYEFVTQQALRREAIGAPGETLVVFAYDQKTGVGGALHHSPGKQPSPQGTMVYLNAEPSLDAWLQRVLSAGGAIVTPKTALPPGMGFFAHFRDSEGNHVGAHALQ